MRYLASTKSTQGQRKNDFCFVPEGELLKYGSECDGENIDGKCGCRRSMVGMICSKSTTTMKVIDLDISEIEMLEKLAASTQRAGFPVTENDKGFLLAELKDISRIADYFPVGTILEKRGNQFQVREEAAIQ